MRWWPLTLLLGFFVAESFSLAKSPESIDVSSVARRLNVDDWGQTQVGRLAWRGGLQLASDNQHFGGLSGLLISADGLEMTAVTDQGRWFTADLDYNADGNLMGLSAPALGRLLGPDGQELEDKYYQDAESLAQLGDGSVLVSFEHDHRILHYPPAPAGRAGDAIKQVPTVWPAFSAMAGLPENDGVEALVHLDGDRILALTAEAADDDLYRGFLWEEGRWQELNLRRVGDFKPTGAAWMPDTGLVVLERRFSLLGGVGVRLRQIDPNMIHAGAVLEGQEIAELTPPLTVDNLEGIALHLGARGEPLVTLLSDDNFNFLQRTLLMMFELRPAEKAQNE